MSICKWCGEKAVVIDSFGIQCAACWLKGAGNGKRKQTSSDTEQGKVSGKLGQHLQKGQAR
jgi:ribosomal protein L37AE/L43A